MKRIISYFKELLIVLKSIDKRLEKLGKCVQKSDRDYGARYSISTKHWND